ncbi:MAG: UDP-N-acetylmuramoyl-tripeptide--D-alanyl-D-alanine ligase [Candidatus Coatesbacteria bacterium]|nr:UDP-N-acetylmuramoyl-tripeptide--D-alanyl-D-alanine ligase [Candidatus Coatesbacteria bacterium]
MTAPIQIQQLARVVGGRFMYPPLHPTYTTGFSIDTRTLRNGDVFVAIKGKHFNGDDFVEKAFLKGACCAVVSRVRWQRATRRDQLAEEGPGPLITVADTTQALAKLGNYFRRKLRAKVIAVTGSLGKTATRELIYAVLSRAAKTHRSMSNYNNIYGLPLSILEAKTDCEYLVLELGMSAKGEIAQLADICEPDLGVVTNVSSCHTEFFRSLDEVADAKAELFAKLPAKGALFLNADDERLQSRSSLAKCEVVGFGLEAGDFRADNLKALGVGGTAFEVAHRGESFAFRCPFLGTHNVRNALAAVAVGKHLGMTWEAIADGLLEASPLPHRLNLVTSPDGRLMILDDSYNASPAAVRAAIDALLELHSKFEPQRQVVVVLADMLELGEISESEHYRIGVFIGSRGLDRLLLLGPLSEHIASGARDSGMPGDRISHCASVYDLRKQLDGLQGGAWVLIKGSRAWALDRLVDRLTEKSAQEVMSA